MTGNGPRGADASKKKIIKLYSHRALILDGAVKMPGKYDAKSNLNEEEKIVTMLIFFCRQNHRLNVENACEAGRCSLTYSVRCAQSPRLNFTSPNSQTRKVSKNSATISQRFPFNKWKLSVLLHHFIHDEPSVMGLLNKNVSGAGVNLF